MDGEQLAYDFNRQSKIWSMLCNFSDDAKRDAVLASIGLSRIDMDHTQYFLTTCSGSYSYASNLQIIDPKRWMLSQLKHGL